MTKRQLMYLGCAALMAATGLGAAAPAPAEVTHHLTHFVRAGQSIQAAVDAALPGDTVTIAPGTYRQSVVIKKHNLTLRGTGGRTVLKPAAASSKNACAKSGNGICVLGTRALPVKGVRIQSLTLSGYKKSGIWATGTDRLTVQRVYSESNKVWGIAQEWSTRSVLTHNIARKNGDAGIFVANTVTLEAGATDTGGTVVGHNLLFDNRIGATIRRVRNLTVQYNSISGNCAGVFVVGDESKPRAGDLTVRGNRISSNNKYCKATARLPQIQGTGLVLTGAEDTLVDSNLIWDNVGKYPLSGGIVLFKSFVGAANTGNVIRGNVVLRNGPADLANRDVGTGNQWTANMCRVSQPGGMC
ncbi:right-handed parallel beta-helix repeat-containing protein [Streptomyces sp. NPDC006208]|uniref:right-handed parallel beta-helix repeat-containing protein n=1 Tax=Streptomyces sp. NPDC006208 TaxID=3156734 RepID=UPI0033BDF878